MSRKVLFRYAAFSLMAALSWGNAWAGGGDNNRIRLRNAVGIELLGNSLLYSFYYQRMLDQSFGLDAGLAMYGGSDGDGSSFVAFIPFGAKVYLIPKNGSIYLTGGGVLLTASTSSGPFDEEASTLYGYAGLGFEHRADGGFIFRFTAYSLFANGGFFIWPGLTIGYSF